MHYIHAFTLPTELDETSYLLGQIKLDMGCYDQNNPYPFKIFPQKQLTHMDFTRSPITILYGGNGSGKSTLFNLIAQKLGLARATPFNHTPFFDDYLQMCSVTLQTDGYGRKKTLPAESSVITSDEVFDLMLNLRTVNQGIDLDRERMYKQWDALRKDRAGFQMRSLSDYEDVVRHRDAARSTRADFTARRIGKNIPGQSNGESAYGYFAEKIRGHALYLLDEPENSLSASRQLELASFLEDSARFYECQFIVATHSPFLLAMKRAVIYDLDRVPVATRKWTELANVRLYHDFFEAHRGEFDD